MTMSHSERLDGRLQRRLKHDDYTVGWICALPFELTAAEAMFDDVHITLENPPRDENVYSYGSISGHNVVMTILPKGIYGMTTAATAAISMINTFRSISIPLLVGIGGGISMDDMRLGDVVISVPTAGTPAVVQYDYGKLLRSGGFERTGHLNKPTSQLLVAAAKLQAKHLATASRLPAILEKALQNETLRRNGFSYPGFGYDVLWQNCQHDNEQSECVKCELKPMTRKARLDTTPKIHYGSIASGNQVIKNRNARDKLVSILHNICFEMEAAGVMDRFPALVIRGISDFSDSQKNRKFQHYAALTAAAVAKELLSMVPCDRSASIYELSVAEKLVQSLDFIEASSRLATINDAHPATLGWFLQHSAYVSWLDDSKIPQHHGLLWIKGKPGAGKSTLMKYILSQTSPAVISFFFNARGTELQKTILGMYRSLLYQIFRLCPELIESLEIFKYENQLSEITVLRNLFGRAVKLVPHRLTCLIDALDESNEDEVRDMIDDLEMILEYNTSDSFRVCCSSRYYPSIMIQAGVEFFLDQERGHSADIEKYIDSKLRIGRSPEAKLIKSEMVRKAAGVFLWVVLVVQILRKTYDHGEVHLMNEKLSEIPSELDALFRDMLLRDNEKREELLTCLQWVLYCYGGIQLGELYEALLCGYNKRILMHYNRSDVKRKDMERFILTVSKGLLEVVPSEGQFQVQVIHETVREYLLDGRLINVWQGFANLAPGPSHSNIALCCLRYLMSIVDQLTMTRDGISADLKQFPTASLSFRDGHAVIDLDACPLAFYSLQQGLTHAEVAEHFEVSQADLLAIISNLTQRDGLVSMFQTFKISKGMYMKVGDVMTASYHRLPSLSSFLAESGFNALLQRYLSLNEVLKPPHLGTIKENRPLHQV